MSDLSWKIQSLTPGWSRIAILILLQFKHTHTFTHSCWEWMIETAIWIQLASAHNGWVQSVKRSQLKIVFMMMPMSSTSYWGETEGTPPNRQTNSNRKVTRSHRYTGKLPGRAASRDSNVRACVSHMKFEPIEMGTVMISIVDARLLFGPFDGLSPVFRWR